jgi:YggT family protein
MFIGLLINIVQTIGTLLMAVVIIDIIISYFISPYNQFRMLLDRIVNPMLNPLRRVIPPLGGIDFSPVVLIILIQVAESLLITVLATLG